MQIYLSNKDGGTEKFHNRCRTNQKISYAGHFHLKKKKNCRENLLQKLFAPDHVEDQLGRAT